MEGPRGKRLFRWTSFSSTSSRISAISDNPSASLLTSSIIIIETEDLVGLDSTQRDPEQTQKQEALKMSIPRSSTPIPLDDPYYILQGQRPEHRWSFNNDVYEHFEKEFDIPDWSDMERQFSIRGLKELPSTFISGHFQEPPLKFGLVEKFIMLESLNLSHRPREDGEGAVASFLQDRWHLLGKRWRRFLRRFRKLVRNPCDYQTCPHSCECQMVKSFLNKRLESDL